jgi:hypothetical protein
MIGNATRQTMTATKQAFAIIVNSIAALRKEEFTITIVR